MKERYTLAKQLATQYYTLDMEQYQLSRGVSQRQIAIQICEFFVIVPFLTF